MLDFDQPGEIIKIFITVAFSEIYGNQKKSELFPNREINKVQSKIEVGMIHLMTLYSLLHLLLEK